MTTHRDPHRTVKVETDPRLLAQWPPARRRGDRLSSQAEALRRLMLRPGDGLTAEQREALLAAGVAGANELAARARGNGAAQLDLARAAHGARERVFSELEAAGHESVRAVLTGDSESTFIVPDKIGKQAFGTGARMPVNESAVAQLSQGVA